MNISEFKYNLPEELIAQYPPKERGNTNLLVLDRKSGNLEDKKYFDIPSFVQKGDIVVLNETKVLNARTFFLTPIGKRVEVLFLENLEKDLWEVLIGRAKNVSVGNILENEESSEIKIKVLERKGNGFIVCFEEGTSSKLFTKYGHTPLPPYMNRDDEDMDKVRYNTVFSKKDGAVASPTASLNLTPEILKEIEDRGGKIVKIELKIGWGTFAPVREENVEDHNIHREYISISNESAKAINEGIENGNSIWAFGTTVARTLESVASLDEKSNKYLLREFSGYTDLYIYPGYEWKVVDVLVTNFHMPDSSLILLVSSFAGKENIKMSYEYAISKRYKFLSYGDSMLII